MLKREVAWRVCDRVYDIKRSFPRALDLGAGRGYIGEHLDDEGAGKLVQLELSEGMLAHSLPEGRDQHLQVHADEESLPFAESSFDLVVSSLSLHWVNLLPQTLGQVHRVLKPDAPLWVPCLAVTPSMSCAARYKWQK